jgi:hypothetical protein
MSNLLLTRPPVIVAKLSGASSSSDLTTYTFAGLDLGAEHPDRKLFAGVFVRATGTPTISTVTIGGTSMVSQVAAANTSGGNRTHDAIFACAKPTGTTGDLVITMSGSGASRAAYTLYRAIAPALTALDPKTSTSDTPSETITIPARGFAIACASSNLATGAAWTGLSEDTDLEPEATHRYSSALLSSHNGTSSLAVTLTWSGSPTLSAFAMAAFGY